MTINPSMKIREINRFSNRIFSAVAELLPQLAPGSEQPDKDRFKKILKSEGTHFFIAEDNKKIVGVLTVVTYDLLSGTKVWIEDVVVDESQRGKGYGESLVLFAIDFTRSIGAESIDLTSKPSRTAANQLYLKLGFKIRQTNVYRYEIKQRRIKYSGY